MALTKNPKEILEKSKNPLLGKRSYKRIELNRVANVKNGFAFHSARFNTNGRGMPVIRIRDVGEDQTDTFYNGKYDENFIVRKGDLLVGMDGDFRIAFWKNTDALLNQRVCSVEVDENKYSKKYLFYYLQPFLNEIHKWTSSVTVKHLSSKTIVQIPLIDIPLEDQIMCVETLDSLFSKLDFAEEDLEKVEKMLEVYRQGVLKQAFEGGYHKSSILKDVATVLTEQLSEKKRVWEVNYLSSHNTVKNDTWKKKYKHPRKTNVAELPTLPRGWVWTNIEEVSAHKKNAIKAGPFGSALKKSTYTKSGFKIYGQEQVIAGDDTIGDYYISETHYKQLQSCRVRPGDVLISLVGTAGKVLVLPEEIEEGVINPRLIKITFNKNLMLGEYFKFYLNSSLPKSYFKLVSHGATMSILNMSILKELPIPLPSIQEQKEIIDKIKETYSISESIIGTLKNTKKISKSLRQSILKKAFEGELI